MMLTNYFKIALRNLRKQPGYTAINIFGLTLGLTCTLLIALWVLDELSYDQFHKKADRTYRFLADIHFGGADLAAGCGPAPLVPAILRDYPQVEAACRLRDKGNYSVRLDNEIFADNRLVFADGAMFQVFSFTLVQGDAATALAEPNTAVITEKAARKYFGERNPLGALLHFDNQWEARVTGVMRDIPENSHLKGDCFVSMPTLEESKEENWLSHNFNSYLVFKQGYDPAQFSAEWPKIVQRYTAPMAEKVLGQTWAEFEGSGNKLSYSMMPLTDIHLYGGNRLGDFAPNGSVETVKVFGIIAFFILLLAAVNFMNLSTARSTQRAREVGVRKVMGSPRSHLVGQFLTESVLLGLLAGIPALLAVQLLLPAFNTLAGKQIAMNAFQRPEILLGALGFMLFTGLMAGLYPAFVLSAFQPVKVLKPGNTGKRGGAWLRNSLVTFQFAISMMLIVGALVTYRQMHFIRNKNLGFDRSQVVVLSDAITLGEKAKTLKEQVLQLPTVASGTITSNLPTNYGHNDQAYFKDRDFSPENAMSLHNWWVDADFFTTMRIPMVKGRNFDPISLADSNAVIINEAAARLLGYADPLDKMVYTLGDVQTQEVIPFRIVGVAKDFNFESLRDAIGPMILHRGPAPSTIAFRLNTSDYATTLDQIKALWQKAAPGLPFKYEFMDDQFDQMYRSESRAGTLALLFAVLAIIIACLGLFGLAAFTAEQRTKEIGVRKVLGASVAGITGMLTADFLKLVVLAILIASPIAYYFMQQWLRDFAYHIEIQGWMFVATGLLAVMIAFLTVSFQSIRAALANPVKSLRSE